MWRFSRLPWHKPIKTDDPISHIVTLLANRYPREVNGKDSSAMMPFLCIINAPYTPMIPSADAHFLTFLALPPLWEVPEEPDHTEFMVLALQLGDVYGESILGFSRR